MDRGAGQATVQGTAKTKSVRLTHFSPGKPFRGRAAAAKSLQSCPTLCDPMTAAHQAPLSLGFSRQEHWSGLPFPSPGDLPNPGVESASSALGGFFTV